MLLNHSHASKGTKCISMCDDQTHPMTARTQNEFQLLLTKTFDASVDRNESQKVLTKPLSASEDINCMLTNHLPCLRRHKMYLILC
jgi:hypothetical protein